MSPTSYRCSIPRDSFYSLATHRAARPRTSCTSDLARSEEQRDPLLQPCHRRTIRDDYGCARIRLHADHRLAGQHVSVVTRVVHHVVVGLLDRDIRAELRPRALRRHDLRVDRRRLTGERVPLDLDRDERAGEQQPGEQEEHGERGAAQRRYRRAAGAATATRSRGAWTARTLPHPRHHRARGHSDGSPIASPPAEANASQPSSPSSDRAARMSGTPFTSPTAMAARSPAQITAASLRTVSSEPVLCATFVFAGRYRRMSASSCVPCSTASTASDVGRSTSSPRRRRSSKPASSRAVTTLSSPRFAASKSNI